MKKIAEKAMEDKDVAMAIIGQAIIDEGSIGADGTLVVTYTSRQNAVHLWNVANRWGLVHHLRTKEYENHSKWCVSFRAEGRRDIYQTIGPLPDKDQDKMFQHILRNPVGGTRKQPRGMTRKQLLDLLMTKPMTIRQLAYGCDISASVVRKHLKGLQKSGMVELIGYNATSPKKNQRTARLWIATAPRS